MIRRIVRTVALTGLVDIDDAPAEVVVGASLLKLREQLLDAATAPPLPTPVRAPAPHRDLWSASRRTGRPA
jgi:hypothetical protein